MQSYLVICLNEDIIKIKKIVMSAPFSYKKNIIWIKSIDTVRPAKKKI